MQKFLVVQTAFIGDVVLATGILEKLHARYPDTAIDILVRKGNESLFTGHPFLHEVLTWNKKESKYKNLFRVIKRIRQNQYDLLINIQRFAATGLLTALSGAKHTIGFDKNPFSFLFSETVRHIVSDGGHDLHETARNHQLIRSITDGVAAKPVLYPSAADEKAIEAFTGAKYICIAPASVWFTKQFPANQWASLMNAIPSTITVYLLGAPGDSAICEQIQQETSHPSVISLAGKLNFLQSAALMKHAQMNYVNDSAPMHFASAVNAPVAAVYCSTIPAFGFGPLSSQSHIIEITQSLACRPCGLHGKKNCPLQHFNCARQISTEQLLAVLPQ